MLQKYSSVTSLNLLESSVIIKCVYVSKIVKIEKSIGVGEYFGAMTGAFDSTNV